jgi:hypothetical protein
MFEFILTAVIKGGSEGEGEEEGAEEGEGGPLRLGSKKGHDKISLTIVRRGI